MIPLGIHKNIPAEEYHADPAISASSLCYLLATSPAHLRHRLDNGSKATPAMEFGSVFHAWVLEPERVEETFHLRPDEIDGEKWHGGKKACKEWLKTHSGKPVLTSEEIEDVKGMAASLRENTEFMGLMGGGASEVSIFALYEGIRIKGRLDIYHQEKPYIVDLKKTVSAKAKDFERSAFDLRYHCRAAWYSLLRELHGENNEAFHLVAIERDAPYANAIYTIERSNILFEYGMREIIRAFQIYKRCLLSGAWPSYPSDSLKPPAWAIKEIEASL